MYRNMKQEVGEASTALYAYIHTGRDSERGGQSNDSTVRIHPHRQRERHEIRGGRDRAAASKDTLQGISRSKRERKRGEEAKS